jgi:transcriptional regulator of NAD metabolism
VSKRCQKIVKKLSKSCQKVVKKLSKMCHHRTLKPKTQKTGKFERRSDQESTMKKNLKEEAMMKKLGIRRLDAKVI